MPESKPSGGNAFVIRLTILLIVLGAVGFALWQEFSSRKEAKRVAEAVEEARRTSLVTTARIREIVGRKPKVAEESGNYFVEEFRFPGGVPGRSYKYFVVYSKQPFEKGAVTADGDPDRSMIMAFPEELPKWITNPSKDPAPAGESGGPGVATGRGGGGGGGGRGGGGRGGGRGGFTADSIMERMDKDKDGKISKEEAAGSPMAADFDSNDENKDGLVDKAELEKAMAALRSSRGGRGGNRGGRGGGRGRPKTDDGKKKEDPKKADPKKAEANKQEPKKTEPKN